MKDNKLIFVLGEPASGKTTLISYLAKGLKKKGYSSKCFNDGVVLREICQQPEGRGYRYDDKMLVLLPGFREEILNGAYAKLAEKVDKRACAKFNFVEFTSPNWRRVLLNNFKTDLLKEAGVIFMDSRGKNGERNLKREDRVPQEYLDLFSGSVINQINGIFEKYCVVVNSGDKLELKKKAELLVGKLLEENAEGNDLAV